MVIELVQNDDSSGVRTKMITSGLKKIHSLIWVKIEFSPSTCNEF